MAATAAAGPARLVGRWFAWHSERCTLLQRMPTPLELSPAHPRAKLPPILLHLHASHTPTPHPLPSPTLCVQAAMKHPYAKVGYAAALLMGLLGWAIATGEKKYEERKHSHAQPGGSSK